VFEKIIPELASRFTVYAYDYPGHGSLGPSRRRLGVDDAATATFAPPCAIYFAAFSPDAPFSGSPLAARDAIRAHSCDHRFDHRERQCDGTGRGYSPGQP
jgi:hypothetical protein